MGPSVVSLSKVTQSKIFENYNQAKPYGKPMGRILSVNFSLVGLFRGTHESGTAMERHTVDRSSRGPWDRPRSKQGSLNYRSAPDTPWAGVVLFFTRTHVSLWGESGRKFKNQNPPLDFMGGPPPLRFFFFSIRMRCSSSKSRLLSPRII